MRTGKRVARHRVHESAITSVYTVGRRIFSGSWDQTLMVMDTEEYLYLFQFFFFAFFLARGIKQMVMDT